MNGFEGRFLRWNHRRLWELQIGGFGGGLWAWWLGRIGEWWRMGVQWRMKWLLNDWNMSQNRFVRDIFFYDMWLIEYENNAIDDDAKNNLNKNVRIRKKLIKLI